MPPRTDSAAPVVNRHLPSVPAENRTPYQPEQYVTPIRLLEILFEKECRPSMRWLRSLTAGRKIPFVKLGGKILFKVSEVEAFLAKGKGQPK